MTVRSCSRIVSLALGMLGLLASLEAFARNETASQPRLNYKEEGSFGSVRPNDVAKPAATDLTPERQARSVDTDGSDSSQSYWSSGSSKPKYREIYESMTKRGSSYSEDDELGISIGIGLGFKTFHGSAGVTFPFNRYAAWGLNAGYMNQEDKELATARSMGEADFILRLPNPSPFTPFVTLGVGYESWRRAKDDGEGLEVFDQSESPTINSSMGGAIRLARYVALTGALKSTTYTADPPRVFTGDHRAAESRTEERFDLGIALMF